MLNTTVRAAAEGMPAINRRRMLMGLAVASTTAATVTLADAAQPEENPELIRLGDQLPAVEAAYVAARNADRSIFAEWNPRLPHCPKEISGGSEHVRNLAGAGVKVEGKRLMRMSADDLEWFVDREKEKRDLRRRRTEKGRDQTRRWYAKNRRELKIARKYEAEHERICKVSGYDAAWRKTAANVEALEAHVAAIMEQPDHTMVGLMVKAQALAAWGRVEGLYKIPFRHGANWPGQIAASILRHAEGGAA